MEAFMVEHFYLSRRQFAWAGAGALAHFSFAAPSATTAAWSGPAVVKKVYLGGRPSWPRPDVELKQDIADIEVRLSEVERRYPGQIRFTGGEMVSNLAETSAWLERSGDADVILAFNLVTNSFKMLEAVVGSGKPTLVFALPYAGHNWTHAVAFIQKGKKIDLIASSDFADLDPYIPLFNTIHHLRHSKVLLVAQPAARPQADGYTQQFGTTFAYPAYTDIKAAYEAADVKKARKMAGEFIRAAAKVVEPTEDEIVRSMQLHLGIQSLLKQEKANAIAIECLGGFGRKELPAYPCISFSKLNDMGMYGVCECDLESTMTQLLVTSFSGKPGFVSDPVFDTSHNEVIHAHCVSATKLRGIDGEPSPYMVRSHLEDHKGASMQVLAPVGDAVTVARFTNPTKFMVSTGEALGNVDNERGCRTKIRTRVKDASKYLENWSTAVNILPGMPGTRDLLHRVVFYGDHTKEIQRLARLTGFKTVVEC
jgi:hypothetical protein